LSDRQYSLMKNYSEMSAYASKLNAYPERGDFWYDQYFGLKEVYDAKKHAQLKSQIEHNMNMNRVYYQRWRDDQDKR